MFDKNIRETGVLYEGDEPLFYQLVVTETELEELMNKYGSYAKISELYKVDFISVKLKTEVDFIHLTSPKNKSSIEKLGLIMGDSDYIPDLGKGVYVIDIYSEQGFENLKDFVVDKEEEELLIVEGCHRGEIELCVYGEGHEGYIVISDDIESENLETKIISIDDFLTTCITEFQY